MAERITHRPAGLPPNVEVADSFEMGVDPASTPPLEAHDDAEGLRRKAVGPAPTLDDALLAPPAGRGAGIVDLGAVTAALHAVCTRGPEPGEAPQVQRMRQIAGRYLQLRLEVAAGISRIRVG